MGDERRRPEAPDLVVCQQVVGGRDGLDDLRIAAAAGFGAVSLHTSRLGGLPTARWSQELDALGLTVAGYMAIRGILDDPVDAPDAIAAAAALGATYVVVTTGPLRGRPAAEADETSTAWFARTQPVAADAGLRLALEPLHPHLDRQSYVHTVGHARRLLRHAPGAGVLVDTAHVWWDERLVDDVAAAPDAVVAVQLGDVDPALLAVGGYNRVPFGTGAVPNATLVRGLRRAGYAGAIEHETLMPPGPDRVDELVRARRWLAAEIDPAPEQERLP